MLFIISMVFLTCISIFGSEHNEEFVLTENVGGIQLCISSTIQPLHNFPIYQKENRFFVHASKLRLRMDVLFLVQSRLSSPNLNLTSDQFERIVTSSVQIYNQDVLFDQFEQHNINTEPDNANETFIPTNTIIAKDGIEKHVLQLQVRFIMQNQ